MSPENQIATKRYGISFMRSTRDKMIRFKKRCSTSLTIKPVNTYFEE